MCAYKLVTVEFKWFGLQNRVESFIQKVTFLLESGILFNLNTSFISILFYTKVMFNASVIFLLIIFFK